MSQSKGRLIVDILLVALLVFEMLYLVTGDTLHEILGIAFFGTVGAHLILTRRMSGALLKRARMPKSKGKSLPASGKARLVLAVLLAVDGAVLLVSSLAISNLLMAVGFGMTAGGAYGLWTLIHIGSAYVLCGLVVFHAAAHWATFFKGSSIPYNPARRRAIQSWVMGGAAIGAAVLGITSVAPLSSRLNNAFADETDQSDAAASGGAGGSELGGSSSSRGQSGESGSAGEAGGSAQSSQPYRGSERDYGRGPRGYSGGSTGSYGNSSSGSGGDGDASSGSGGTFNGSSGSGGVSNGSSGSSGSSGASTSDLCTLCPKRCSLSSPRCNRPYAAGLL